MTTTFILFSDLPTEIRSKIWAAAIDHPRLIHPQQPPVNSPSEHPKHYYHCKAPILLQICKESRKEALLRYHHVPLPGGSYLGPQIHLNPSTDILYLGHETSTPPHHGVLGQFGLFSSIYIYSFPLTPWSELRAMALCSSGAQRLVEPLCLRFPKLERVYLVEAPEKMQESYLAMRRMADHLERRREARGDEGIQYLDIRVVSWAELRWLTGEWNTSVKEKGKDLVMRCRTCLLRF